MPKASIIIVNYNGKRFLADCFNSLKKQTFKDFEILLVDNASKDDSVEFIKQNYPKTKIIVNPSNLGFAGGNNVGYQQTKGEYVVLLNNDTIVDKNWLKELLNTAEKNKKIALVGAVSFPFGTSLAKANLSAQPPSTLGVTGADIKLSPNQEGMYIDGASLLIRKKLFKEPFDSDYFCYAEDIYLSWLANIQGYRTVHSKAKYLHYGSGTSGKRSAFAVYHVERNNLMNFLIFYESTTLLKLFPLIALSKAVKLASKLSRLDIKSAYSVLKACFWVWFNLCNVLDKRKQIQPLRKVTDSEILKKMGSNLFNEDESFGFIAKALNSLSRAYLSLVGITTI